MVSPAVPGDCWAHTADDVNASRMLIEKEVKRTEPSPGEPTALRPSRGTLNLATPHAAGGAPGHNYPSGFAAMRNAAEADDPGRRSARPLVPCRPFGARQERDGSPRMAAPIDAGSIQGGQPPTKPLPRERALGFG
jgi:hypothetical protein